MKPSINMTDEQLQRSAEGFDIVEWQYRDGSGSWGYTDAEDTTALVTEYQAEGCRVWVNGDQVNDWCAARPSFQRALNEGIADAKRRSR